MADNDNSLDDILEEVNQNDDLSFLLNQIEEEDPILNDVQAINEFIKDTESGTSPMDVGDVFSDALSAVSVLEDDEDLLGLLPDEDIESPEDPEDNGEKDRKKDGKKLRNPFSRINSIRKSKRNSLGSLAEGSKVNLFNRLKRKRKPARKMEDFQPEELELEDFKIEDEILSFDELTELEEEPIKDTKDKLENSKKKEEALQKAEEKKELKKEKKLQRDIKKRERKIRKAEKSKESKEKKHKFMTMINEIEDNETKINKMVVALVSLSLSLLIVLIVIGSNVFSYSQSIRKATYYFEVREYNEAFEEVNGIEPKDKDVEIFDKIMTIMYVNKQLNSYNNYYAMGMHPEALDSLLKGLNRYDKYIDLASILGIDNDLDYVRDQIIAELKTVFIISEEEAMNISKIRSKEDYGKKVYTIASNLEK